MYTGIKVITLSDSQLAKFYENDNSVELGLHLNEYLLIQDSKGDFVDKFRFDGNKLIKVNYKTVDNEYINKLKPRNYRQECLFDLLQNDSIKVKLITGSMGGGKTFLTVHHALDKIGNKRLGYKKIIYVRNNVEVKDSVPLGALPNGIRDKLLPFIMPICDAVGGLDALEFLERRQAIEYVHLGFIRGRSFSDSIIIISEAENLTREHVKLLLGRVGEGSIIIFEGDLAQTDKKIFETNSGIIALRDILKGNPLFGSVELDKSERSDVAELSNLF